MATEQTVKFGPPHAPKDEAINVFKEIEHQLKKDLVHLRHEHDKHDTQSFAVARDLSDNELAGFTEHDFVLVRVAPSSYGIHLFGKLRIPALPDSGPAYIHFRAFTDGPDRGAKLHSIHTEEKGEDGSPKTFKTFFTKGDAIGWFDS